MDTPFLKSCAENLRSFLERVFAPDTSTLDLPAPAKLLFYTFLYGSVLLAGYTSAKAGYLPPFGGGQWLYAAQEILEGNTPFVDFTIDYAPLSAYVFALHSALFGHSLFAASFALNLSFPLLAVILYHLLATELFKDYRTYYSFLFLVWLFNFYYHPVIPAVALPVALLITVLSLKWWINENGYGLLFSGILLVLLFFTSPFHFFVVCLLLIILLFTGIFFYRIPPEEKLIRSLCMLLLWGSCFLLVITIWGGSAFLLNYTGHFYTLYIDGYAVWYQGSILSWHLLPLLFCTLALGTVAWKHFSSDRSAGYQERFLPLFMLCLFSLLSALSLFISSRSGERFLWFPSLLILFTLLVETYYNNRLIEKLLQYAHSFGILKGISRMKSFRALGGETFTLLFVLLTGSAFLYSITVGFYPIHRTAVKKYFFLKLNEERLNGKQVSLHQVYDPQQGVWRNRYEMQVGKRLANYLHYEARLYDDILFIPIPLFPNPFEKKSNIPFFSIENAFNQKDRKAYLTKWEVIKPRYIVMDTRKNWLRNSADYLVQEFENFVEKNYHLEKQIDYFDILKLNRESTQGSLYREIPLKEASLKQGFPRSFADAPSFFFQKEAELTALDISYTFIKPDAFPSPLMRPFMTICPVKENGRPACKEISLPYTTEEPVHLRIRFRKKKITAKGVRLFFAPFSHTLFRPVRAELFSIRCMTK